MPQTHSKPAPVRISLEQALQIAKEHRRKKEMVQARSLYAQILRSFPDNAEAKAALQALDRAFAIAHRRRGLALLQTGDRDGAIASFRKAIEVDPKFAQAHEDLGITQFYMGDLTGAIGSFDRALGLDPDIANAFSLKRLIQAQICDFSATAGAAIRDDHTVFEALAFEDDPARQRHRSERTWRTVTRGITALPMPPRPHIRPARLRVGYFSSDFHDHATMHLMSGLLREHDRARFEIVLYSYGSEKTGQFRDHLIRSDLEFHDMEPLRDEEITELARSHRLDLAVDLKGWTQGSRSRLFAYRPAPVQINYLGFPGTIGSDCFDYILADGTIIPDEFGPFYSEQVLRLPHSYQPNDNWRTIDTTPTARSDFGLPEDAVVLCCFNASYKIGVSEFDIWMRALAKVEKSVLWLLRSGEWMERNVRKAAAERGIDPDRLIFADKTVHSQHVARHRHADLFLDTFHCNAHTTASDALWAGLPVVTKAGRQFAARVAASLLNAVGLPDLIAETEEEYEAKIVRLATHPDELMEIRERLARNRLTHPLFDTKRYTRNFEAGLQLAYDRYFAGEKPADITVSDPG